jgi:hypothetical protein
MQRTGLRVPVVALFLSHPVNPQRWATAAKVAAHLRDYPASLLTGARLAAG